MTALERAQARTIARLTAPDVRHKTAVAFALRVLLLVEWSPMKNGDGKSCTWCHWIRPRDRHPRKLQHVAHGDHCKLDEALRRFGLNTQGERDRQRKRIP